MLNQAAERACQYQHISTKTWRMHPDRRGNGILIPATKKISQSLMQFQTKKYYKTDFVIIILNKSVASNYVAMNKIQ